MAAGGDFRLVLGRGGWCAHDALVGEEGERQQNRGDGIDKLASGTSSARWHRGSTREAAEGRGANCDRRFPCS